MAARRALPLLLVAAVLLGAAAPAHGETIELGTRRWLQDMGAAVAPAMGPTAADAGGLDDMGYISYGALKPNTVPCSIPGESYYNCGMEGAEVNPYTRSCSQIFRCRG